MKLNELFHIYYPRTLIYSEMTPDDGGINFVSSQEKNNGVVGRVKREEGIKIYPAKCITVPLKGSVLMAHLQHEPCYVAHQIAVLVSKSPMSDTDKLCYVTYIRSNAYKYSYGRQADRTLGELELPDVHSINRFPVDVRPIKTANTAPSQPLCIDEWEDFSLGALMSEIYKAKAHNKDDLVVRNDAEHAIRYITRTGEDNGCELIVSGHNVDKDAFEAANAITIGDTTATCFYQNRPFIAGDHMVVLRADWLNEARALFILSILRKEQYKYSYGRAFLMDRIRETVLKLPIVRNADGSPYIDESCRFSAQGYEPDWTFMDNYIKSLPYGDRI